eukprot:356225-Chlamydomonas_euryale.AAC.17
MQVSGVTAHDHAMRMTMPCNSFGGKQRTLWMSGHCMQLLLCCGSGIWQPQYESWALLAPTRPVGNFKSSREYHYQALKMNVDMLKVIQLGLTLTDADGNLPLCNGELCVWQFNFRGFNLADDVYAQDSIELLIQSGIDFERHESQGIDVQRFGEAVMSSGLVLNEDITWITFHSGCVRMQRWLADLPCSSSLACLSVNPDLARAAQRQAACRMVRCSSCRQIGAECCAP